ncbi:rhodanese-like domain-containing protein [Natrialbaceae archaeon A-gly3]
MERKPNVRRRRVLLAAGGAIALAGCTGSGDDENDDNGGDDDPDDTETGANGDEENGDDGDETDTPTPDSDDHETHEGVDVPIVPLEDALEWYEAEAAHFVDARGSEDLHENARIPGSVWSPNSAGTDDDSIDDWASDEPIVVYSGELDESSLCVIRATGLIEDGHEYVYVLEDGFGEWRNRNYPMEGLGPDGELEGDEDEEGDG